MDEFNKILTELNLSDKFSPISIYFVNITMEDLEVLSEDDLMSAPREEHVLLMTLFCYRLKEYKRMCEYWPRPAPSHGVKHESKIGELLPSSSSPP
jgi:hypothetical protein